MVSKHTIDKHPSPPGFNLQDTFFHIPINSWEFYLSSEYLLNFLSNLSNLQFHHDWEKFSNFCSDYWEMQLQATKLTLNNFTNSFQSTFSLRFLSSLPHKEKLLVLLQTAFFQKSVLPAEEVWGDYVNNNYNKYKR